MSVLSSPLIIFMIIKHSSVIVMIMPDSFSLIGLLFCGWVKSFCGAFSFCFAEETFPYVHRSEDE